MDHPRADSSSRSRLLLWGLAGLLLAGCGADVYEKRLGNTSALYRHLQLLDTHLNSYWSDGAVRLRVPQQFSELPAPPPPPKSAGNDPAAHVVDDRQPQFINVELPGLRGAFTAKLSILDAENNRHEVPGHLYVLTNHGAGAKAGAFNDEVVSIVCEATRIPAPSRTGAEWSKKSYPSKSGAFVTPVQYDVVVPQQFVSIDGVESQLTFDLFQQGEVHVALVWLIPRDVESSEKMSDRRESCLETLRVTGSKLTAPRGSSKSGGSVAGGRKPPVGGF